MPAIITLVDIGNLVSLRRALPVAVIDLAGVAGGITVRFATGAERFTDLGGDHDVAAAKEDLVALLDEFQAGHSARSWQLAPARR